MSRERRRPFLEEEPPAEPGRYGCPLLTRAHCSHPVFPGRPFMRCSAGWAIHDDVDAQKCLATESVADCWKVHPERMPLVVLKPALGPEFVETEQKSSAD